MSDSPDGFARNSMRRTKIVATIGPKTRDEHSLRALLQAGVDVIRLNFAHDSPEVHGRVVHMARKIADELGRVVGVLIDLPGPKMRTGPVHGGAVELTAGARFTLTEEEIEGDEHRISTTVEDLAKMVSIEEEIFLADGEVVLKVDSVQGSDVHTIVVRGGVVRSGKGVHLPSMKRRLQAFTPEDQQALKAAVDLEADLVGLSYVHEGRDVQRARSSLPKKAYRPVFVAKIETAAAVHHLEEIVNVSDVVMVARGDLGIETPLRRVPLLQKQIIRACNEAGKPVITATEMLESMTEAPLPTRAEVTDVANAVLDGTDALMLSEETAVGRHPVEAVRTMADIAQATETREDRAGTKLLRESDDDKVSWAVAHAAVQAAEDLRVAAILCYTRYGSTPRRVAAFRPRVPIIGLSAHHDSLGALALVWGVTPVCVPPLSGPRDLLDEVGSATEAAREAGLVSQGQLVAVAGGSPGPRAGATNYVHVARV